MPSLIGNKPNQVPTNGDLGTLAFEDADNVIVGNLNATGVTTVRAGTAAAPAITTTGDTNTGIFFPAADTIAFTEGGVESMRINSSGNLSIGTTASQSSLQIAKDGIASGAGWTSVLKATDSANNKGLDFGYDASSQTSIILSNTSSAASNLAFWTYTGAAWGERMRITSTGSVGIGVSAPASPLSFAATTGQKIRLFNSVSGYGIGVESSEFRFVTDSSAVFTWGTGTYASPTERMRIDSSGNLSIGTTASQGRLTVSSNSGTTILTSFTNSALGTSIGNGGTITISQFFGGGPVYSGTLYLTVIGGGGADSFNNITRQYAVRFYTNTGTNNQNTLTALTAASAASGGQGGNMTDIVATCTGTNSRDLTITVTTSTTENRRFHAVFTGSVV